MLDRSPTIALRSLYVRGLALCHAVALLSFGVQADALLGERGVTPLSQWMSAVSEARGLRVWVEHPSLLWLWPDTAALHALWAGGLLLALAVVAGLPWEGPALVGLWAVYLSLCSVSDVFLGYQWDSLLVEATFCGALVARWRKRTGEPPPWAWWVQWWLVFRLMFFAGWVKWTSGDPSWHDLTALDYHFWTQPLPGPISRWAHHWPRWLHALGVMFTLLVEMIVPFAIPFGRKARALAAALFATLMGMLALTGNYGFFQLLSLVLFLSLLDDGWLPERLRGWLVRPDAEKEPWHLGLVPAVAWFGLSLLWCVGFQDLPSAGQAVLRAIYPFQTVNPYGLFAVMTKDRREIILEGSDDGQTWRELYTRYKPGPVDRVPPQVAPHMPRVDWQLWFAALGSCRENPWLVRLMVRVAQGSPSVESLFLPGTFDASASGHAFAQGHPKLVRAVAYRYTFTEPGARDVWSRELLGLYCPVVSGEASTRRP